MSFLSDSLLPANKFIVNIYSISNTTIPMRGRLSFTIRWESISVRWKARCRIMINFETLHIIFIRISNVVIALGEIVLLFGGCLAYRIASCFFRCRRIMSSLSIIDVKGFAPTSVKISRGPIRAAPQFSRSSSLILGTL